VQLGLLQRDHGPHVQADRQRSIDRHRQIQRHRQAHALRELQADHAVDRAAAAGQVELGVGLQRHGRGQDDRRVLLQRQRELHRDRLPHGDDAVDGRFVQADEAGVQAVDQRLGDGILDRRDLRRQEDQRGDQRQIDQEREQNSDGLEGFPAGLETLHGPVLLISTRLTCCGS